MGARGTPTPQPPPPCEGEGELAARRGGLIVPVLEAEARIQPSPAEFVPIWSDGMPAHVTLLFPFLRLDQLDAAGLTDLTALFTGTPSIRATFAAIGQFPEFVYLAPEPRAWFVRLTEALSARFGLKPYGGIYADIMPHLTVARHADPAVQARVAATLARFLPFEADVREVWLMEETADGRWDRAATFAVGQ